MTEFVVRDEEIYGIRPHAVYDTYRWRLENAASQLLNSDENKFPIYLAALKQNNGRDDEFGVDKRFAALESKFIQPQFDIVTNLFLAKNRPSSAVGNILPVFDFYRPVLVELEKRIETALYDRAVAEAKVGRANELFVGIRDAEKLRDVYVNTKQALEDFISPVPHTLQAYGTDSAALKLDLDKDRRFDAAVMQDMAALFGPLPKDAKTPVEVLRTFHYDLDTAARIFVRTLLVDYRRTLKILMLATQYERDQVVARALYSMRDIWDGLPLVYRALVLASQTTDTLQKQFAVDVSLRFEKTLAVLEQYKKDFPLLSDIPGAPKVRDYALLFDTEIGRKIADYYRLVRDILKSDTSARQLIAEIPRNVLLSGRGVDGPVQWALQQQVVRPDEVEPMDSIHMYFTSLDSGLVAGGGPTFGLDRGFDDAYWQLQRKKVLEKQASDAIRQRGIEEKAQREQARELESRLKELQKQTTRQFEL